ncbi:VWA domain-containing protein [Deinococcus detaillensis]|uniref:VWA domain-containing protein n=1 Tax=Deinococcus detaillensis TaxID=2592048 RepID=A0A553UPQ6_9DEIO|nr:VWA domain-containing protein [Deinococcus detaillensis]TSA82155.1 VWA domain-containing protein [Deinococcus detaillensis]
MAHTPVAGQPRIELLPLKAALSAGGSNELTLLARIHPAAAPQSSEPRSPLNLSLVIDRSGSMGGTPLEMAKEATQIAIRALQPQDRVSVVTFDSEVEVLIPSQLVTDPEALCRQVAQVRSRGNTALHAGWLEGAMLTAEHQQAQTLNRVLLLSDGGANQGERRPDVIAEHVKGLTARGVGTSTIGLGRSYDEDLLKGMADAGDGNYEHIENAEALPAYFEAELQGLTRTTGHTVSLGVEPNAELGHVRVQVLNAFPVNALGRSQLPNLISGRPIEVVLTLPLTVLQETSDLGITRLRLAWTDRSGVRHHLRAQLNLPVVSPQRYDALPEDARVRLALELLEAARVRQEAVTYADAGQVSRSTEVLMEHRRKLASLPQTPELAAEMHALSALSVGFISDAGLARKRATSQSYDRRNSKSQR